MRAPVRCVFPSLSRQHDLYVVELFDQCCSCIWGAHAESGPSSDGHGCRRYGKETGRWQYVTLVMHRASLPCPVSQRIAGVVESIVGKPSPAKCMCACVPAAVPVFELWPTPTTRVPPCPRLSLVQSG
jgi:hypothetical protein